MATGIPDRLEVYIFLNYVHSALQEDNVNMMASKLGIKPGELLTQEKFTQLYNKVVLNTEKQIAVFLASSEAAELNDAAATLRPIDFTVTKMDRPLREIINRLFPRENPSYITQLSRWVWSVIVGGAGKEIRKGS